VTVFRGIDLFCAGRVGLSSYTAPSGPEVSGRGGRAVLKVHVVREGGHGYYVDDLVPGRAEGTLVAGEARGAWSGNGAASLGLRGPVEAGAFAELLGGCDPASATVLRSRRGDRSVAGYDLTFCAQKIF
jgi:hypothetical protein